MSNSVPEHAMDKIQKPADRVKKLITNHFFQFHFHFRIISKNVLIKTQSHKYTTVQMPWSDGQTQCLPSCANLHVWIQIPFWPIFFFSLTYFFTASSYQIHVFKNLGYSMAGGDRQGACMGQIAHVRVQLHDGYWL